MKTKSNKTQLVKAANEAIAKTQSASAEAPKATKKLKKVIAAQALEETKEREGARDPKYIYPADCTTKEQKKSHRRTMRAKLESFKKAIAKLEEPAAIKAEVKAANEWVRANYTTPESVEFSIPA